LEEIETKIEVGIRRMETNKSNHRLSEYRRREEEKIQEKKYSNKCSNPIAHA